MLVKMGNDDVHFSINIKMWDLFLLGTLCRCELLFGPGIHRRQVAARFE